MKNKKQTRIIKKKKKKNYPLIKYFWAQLFLFIGLLIMYLFSSTSAEKIPVLTGDRIIMQPGTHFSCLNEECNMVLI